jgi:hypothetical protein
MIHPILQDHDLSPFVDGFVDEEVAIGLQSFERDKNLPGGHPAGMVGQPLDGNATISLNIEDLKPLKKLSQTFLMLLVFTRQRDSFETFRMRLIFGKYESLVKLIID